VSALQEWLRADVLWNEATDALLARNYERFDALMHDMRAITKTWKSPTKEARAAQKAAGDNHGD
jgi:hypothetical protein